MTDVVQDDSPGAVGRRARPGLSGPRLVPGRPGPGPGASSTGGESGPDGDVGRGAAPEAGDDEPEAPGAEPEAHRPAQCGHHEAQPGERPGREWGWGWRRPALD